MIKTKEEVAQLLRSIQENLAIVDAEIPPTVPFNEVSVFTRAKITASEVAYQKRQEYKEYVQGHMGAVILKGPHEKQVAFSKLAHEVGKTITFDSQELYGKLTESAFFMMGGTGSLTADQVSLVFTEVRVFTKGELGITRLREPDFHWMFQYSWNDPVKFAQGFRHSLFLTNGIRVTQEALLKKVFDDSLATPIARTTIPVVILGMQTEEESDFKTYFAHGYTVVDLADKEVDEELIKTTFVTLRDTIKAKANQ